MTAERSRPIPGEPGPSGLIPFEEAPGQLARAAAAAWESRDAAGFAWRVLREGVCDTCSLGPRGLHDDAAAGLHLCLRRLEALRAETIGPLAPVDVARIDRLAGLGPEDLHRLGRLPYPFVRRRGGRGFDRVTWTEALRAVADAVGGASQAWLTAGRGLTNEAWFAWKRAAEALGVPAGVDLPAGYGAVAAGIASVLGTGASSASLADLAGTDLVLLWGSDALATHPVVAKYLARARRQGARVASIGPPVRTAAWVPPAPFGSHLVDDVVVASPLGVLRSLRGAPSDRDTEWLARLIARARDVVSVWGDGLASGEAPEAAGAALAELHLAKGALGRPRAGILALLEAPGVHGATDLGLRPLEADPDVAILLGDARPTTARVRVHAHTRMETTMLGEADLVVLLPLLTRHEQPGGGTVTSAERRVRLSPAIPGGPTPPEALPAWEIAARLARAQRPGLALGWPDAAAVRADIAREVPLYAGIERLERAGDWLQWGGSRLFADGRRLP